MGGWSEWRRRVVVRRMMSGEPEFQLIAERRMSYKIRGGRKVGSSRVATQKVVRFMFHQREDGSWWQHYGYGAASGPTPTTEKRVMALIAKYKEQ